MHLVNPDGIGREIGTITVRGSSYGLILKPDLGDLTPGAHGFHVHQNADCGRSVEVFALHGLARAGVAYAWAHETDTGGRRYVAVLQLPPAANAADAVRAAIVAERGKSQGDE